MKPVLTPKEANDLMRDAGDDTSLETFKRGLRQGKCCCVQKAAARIKKRRPGAATPRRQKGNEMNSYILHAKRAIVKGLAVLVGLWCLSALAALNWPALLSGALVLNTALGAYFNLGGITHEDVQRL